MGDLNSAIQDVRGHHDFATTDAPNSQGVETVKVYTRHKRSCPKRERPDWARCSCMKWLYIYRAGKDKLLSAKTRSWERAEQKARELRDAFDPTKQLQRQLESRLKSHDGRVEISLAIAQFRKELERLNREEATRAKYNLTLSRLLQWCSSQTPPVVLLSELDIPPCALGFTHGLVPRPLVIISTSAL